MRGISVALILLVASLALATPARASSVEAVWSVGGPGTEPFGVTVDPRDGTVFVALSDHTLWSSPEYMWAIDPTAPLPYDPPTYPIPRFLLPRPQTMSVLDVTSDRLFVQMNDRVVVVDPHTHVALATLPIGGPGMAVDAATNRVFTATEVGVVAVDATTGAQLAMHPILHSGDAWWYLVHDPLRHRVYVANGSFVGASSLVVLEDQNLQLVAEIPLPATPRLALALDVTRNLVYVGGFTAGSEPSGSIYAIDTTTLQRAGTLALDPGAFVFSLTLVPETNTLYASVVGGPASPHNAVFAIDTATFGVAQRIPVPFEPGQSAMHPDGRLYVTGYDTGELAAITFVNAAPRISPIAFTPAVPSTTSLLVANAQIVEPDGDPMTVSYEWRRNGTTIPDATSSVLDLARPGAGDRGDTVTVTITATDGTRTSTRSRSVVVANGEPLLSVSLSDAAPRTNDLLVATASASDADGDAVALTYRWTRNGALLPVEGNSVDLRTYGDRGDALAVAVTADDGHGAAVTRTATVVIADTAPTVFLSNTRPEPIYTNDVVFATASVTDPDGDAVCCTWAFKRNGVVVWQSFERATFRTFDLNQAGWGDRGDTVTIEATAGDGVLTGSTSWSAVVVNSPPVAGVGFNTYSPNKKDTLIAFAGVNDADGDTGFLLTYTWSVGNKVRAVIGPTSATTSTFDVRSLQPGDVITVVVTTTGDGYDAGTPGMAQAVMRGGK